MITQTEQYSNIKNLRTSNQLPAEAREAQQTIDRVNVERHAQSEKNRVTHGPETANHRIQDDGPTAMARESHCLPSLPALRRDPRRHPRRTARGQAARGPEAGHRSRVQQSGYQKSVPHVTKYCKWAHTQYVTTRGSKQS